MTVYADIVFFANFISTLALILAYTAMCNIRRKLWRVACAAAVSGLYAVFEVVCGLPYILRTAVLFLINMLSFGRKDIVENTIRLAFLIICVQVIFMLAMTAFGRDAYIAGGTVTVFSGDILGAVVYIISYPIMFAVKRIIKKRSEKQSAEFVIGGKSVELTLLYDSGNLLTHKGVSVAVVAWDSLKSLFNDTDYDEFTITAEDRMIFTTVGSGGIMPVITPEKSHIGVRDVNLKIAVSQRTFNGYDGVVGKIES